jgi:hypothetical protein
MIPITNGDPDISKTILCMVLIGLLVFGLMLLIILSMNKETLFQKVLSVIGLIIMISVFIWGIKPLWNVILDNSGRVPYSVAISDLDKASGTHIRVSSIDSKDNMWSIDRDNKHLKIRSDEAIIKDVMYEKNGEILANGAISFENGKVGLYVLNNGKLTLLEAKS